METQNQNPTPPPQVPPAPMPPAPVPMPPVPGASKNIGMAILAYFGILVVIPLITAKDDPFVKFHAKQGLVLLIGWIVVMFIGVFPVIGWLLSMLLWMVLGILSIIGIINAASGKETPLPVIGHLGNSFNI